MAVTAQLVKELRGMTGAGMMDCKKALVECNADLEASVEFLRKKGLSKAAKKGGRIATEGTIVIQAEDNKKVAMTEINCETDFVTKNDTFKEFTQSTIEQIISTNVSTSEELATTTIENISFDEFLKVKITKIGENIVVRRLITIEAKDNGFVASYLHSNGKVGVIVGAKGEASETNVTLLKDICMHAAAMSPKYLNQDDVPSEIIEKETEIAMELMKKESAETGKRLPPENIIKEKIIPGKIQKFKDENSLTGQKFVKDDKKSVAQVTKEAGLEIVDYVRFELGEGLEKKGCDFASEVAEQLK